MSKLNHQKFYKAEVKKAETLCPIQLQPLVSFPCPILFPRGSHISTISAVSFIFSPMFLKNTHILLFLDLSILDIIFWLPKMKDMGSALLQSLVSFFPIFCPPNTFVTYFGKLHTFSVFFSLCFGVVSKTQIPCVFFWELMVLSFTFRFMMHFELFFVKGIRFVSRFSFFHKDFCLSTICCKGMVSSLNYLCSFVKYQLTRFLPLGSLFCFIDLCVYSFIKTTVFWLL